MRAAKLLSGGHVGDEFFTRRLASGVFEALSGPAPW